MADPMVSGIVIISDLNGFALNRFTATEQTSGMEESIRSYQAESVPLRRFAEPHEQGDPALFLISPSVSTIRRKDEIESSD